MKCLGVERKSESRLSADRNRTLRSRDANHWSLKTSLNIHRWLSISSEHRTSSTRWLTVLLKNCFLVIHDEERWEKAKLEEQHGWCTSVEIKNLYCTIKELKRDRVFFRSEYMQMNVTCNNVVSWARAALVVCRSTIGFILWRCEKLRR